MNISMEMVGLDIAHRRELKQLSQQAQGVVDQLDSEIFRLRRELQKANGIIQRLSAENAVLVRERGLRANAIFAARARH